MRPLITAALVLVLLAPAAGMAQVVTPTPPERQVRGFVPPHMIVSFPPDTPFNDFIRYVSPLSQEATGRSIVDPTGRTAPIGFYVTGMYYLDALNLVLEQAGLTSRISDRYLIIEPGMAPTAVAGAAAAGAAVDLERATAADREIRIDAIIFELNLDRVSEIGTAWGAIFSQQGGAGGGGGGGGGTGGGAGGDAAQRLQLFLRTESFFDAISEVIEGPSRIDLSELNRLFRLLESNGVGRTISNPSIVVRSGQEGRIQSGSDIPISLRDFAGNTVTQFIPTGVIISATPHLIRDASDTPDGAGVPLDFIHLIVNVERSAGRLAAAGLTIDKNQATTEVLLLDGEQTVIGGLYTTEESISRSGIPILKDLPLLGLLFGVKRRTTIQRELLIVLQARLVDPLRMRASRPLPTNLRDRETDLYRQRIERFQQSGRDRPVPPAIGD
jgi:type IV pilus assembly protein PilQ